MRLCNNNNNKNQWKNKNKHPTDWPPVAISVFRDDWQLQLTTNWLCGRRLHIHRHACMHIPHLITWASWSFPIPLTCHLWAVHNHTDSAVPRVIHSYTEFHFYQWSFWMTDFLSLPMVTLTFHLYQWSFWMTLTFHLYQWSFPATLTCSYYWSFPIRLTHLYYWSVQITPNHLCQWSFPIRLTHLYQWSVQITPNHFCQWSFPITLTHLATSAHSQSTHRHIVS